MKSNQAELSCSDYQLRNMHRSRSDAIHNHRVPAHLKARYALPLLPSLQEFGRPAAVMNACRAAEWKPGVGFMHMLASQLGTCKWHTPSKMLALWNARCS